MVIPAQRPRHIAPAAGRAAAHLGRAVAVVDHGAHDLGGVVELDLVQGGGQGDVDGGLREACRAAGRRRRGPRVSLCGSTNSAACCCR